MVAKSRSRHVLIGETDADGSVNDNNQGVHPGHELLDLRNVQRQPAPEAVVHYARLSQIASFPDHPRAAPVALASAPAMDAAVEKHSDEKVPAKRRVALACVTSVIFHVTLFTALAIGFVVTPQEPVEETGDAVSVIILGDSDADQASAGSTEPQQPPEPEQVVADAVQPQTLPPTEAKPEQVQPTGTQPEEVQPTDAEVAPTSVQPTPIQPTEAAPADTQPVETEAVLPTQAVTQVSPETQVAAEPEVFTSEVPAEMSVVQPMATTVPETVVPDAQAMAAVTPAETQPAEMQPTEVQPTTAVVHEEVRPVDPVETAEALPDPVPPQEVMKPTPKPKAEQPVEKPKPVEKKQGPPKKTKVVSGSQGENRQDSKKGSSDGIEEADSDRNSRSDGNNNGAGSAAVANYPGKVQSRIRRSVKVPTEYKRMGGAMNVRVRLTIVGSGQLSGVSVARSSGIPELDQAVVDGVKRAAPFPPLPSEWGKPSWSFTQEVQVTGR